MLEKNRRAAPEAGGDALTAAEAIRAARQGRCRFVGGHVPRRGLGRCPRWRRRLEQFGPGIDIFVVNNASAIDLSEPRDLAMKKLRPDAEPQLPRHQEVLSGRTAVRTCARSKPHVLDAQPAADDGRKLVPSTSPTRCRKYGMEPWFPLGMAGVPRGTGSPSTRLWRGRLIAKAAVEFVSEARRRMKRSRTPAIMADRRHEILTATAASSPANFAIDDEILDGGDLDRQRLRPTPTADRHRRRGGRVARERAPFAGGRGDGS